VYISCIKLWNFRKFGDTNFDLNNPHFNLYLNENLNVFIGENDSGKSTIIDSIKLVLKTHSFEWIKVTENDFYKNSNRLRIEIIFKGLKPNEARYFTEWLGWDGEGDKATPKLRLIYDVNRNSERIFPADVKAGMDDIGYSLSAEAREFLKVTYLRPLRDAEHELIPKKYSRLSQILLSHEAFEDRENHELIKIYKNFNKSIENYFHAKDFSGTDISDEKGKKLKDTIDSFISDFCKKGDKGEFKAANESMRSILEKLELSIKDFYNPGLGTLNRLFMAAELLHLNKENWDGLRLGLIEELEAHLHPQAQMKVIESLQKLNDIQLILTTHSPNLASKVKLDNLILFNNNYAFSLRKGETKLDNADYDYLEKFLDVTKANLFFAKGVIIVEGWSEALLLPELAKKLGYDLTKNEISVVNVGNLGFSHFSRIFLRKDTTAREMNVKVAIITDCDVKEYEQQDGTIQKIDDQIIENKSIKKFISLKNKHNVSKNKVFYTPNWTLEWCLYKSETTSNLFKEAVGEIHSGLDLDDFENELAKKLLPKGGLKKPKIIQKLATKIRNDNTIDFMNIDEKDEISYLIEAIKYVCE